MKRLRVRAEIDRSGGFLYYPVCPEAYLIVELLGTKTIPPSKVETLRALGYELENIYSPHTEETK